MKYALLHGNRVVQVADETFPVHPSFRWVQCADDVIADRFSYDGSAFTPIISQAAPAQKQLVDVLLEKGIITRGDLS